MLVRLDPVDSQLALEQAEADLAQTVRAVSTLAVSIGYGAFFGSIVLLPLWLQHIDVDVKTLKIPR